MPKKFNNKVQVSKKEIKVTKTNKSNSNFMRDNVTLEENKNSYHLIPVFFILCIIPFIVKLKDYKTNLSQFQWFPGNDDYMDFFLYYKQWAFIFVAGVMAIFVVGKAYVHRKSIKLSPIFIPLIIYALLVLLSAIFSDYASFCFSGSYELFESVFVLIGYCIVVFYACIYFHSEHDFKLIFRFVLFTAVVMSILGVLQYSGHDFYASDLGYKLIMPTEARGNGITFNFGESRVYLSLYNPNYVGVYVAFIVPILLVMTFFQKKVLFIILSVLSMIGLVICTIGAQSAASIIGLVVAVFIFILFMWRYLIKRFYITIPVVIVFIIGIIVINAYTDQLLVNKIKMGLHLAKTEPLLTRLVTEDDKVSLTYKGNEMNMKFVVNDAQTGTLIAYDENDLMIDATFDTTNNYFVITDQRFSGIIYGYDTEINGAFYFQIDGIKWRFTNQTEDGTYYYINRFNKLDKMINAKSAVFTGYESIASNRGYIWSRTIPLLKDYIFLGSGPNTYTMAFPQQDYMNMRIFGYGDALLTKPHSMYLQMAVQTGVLSLVSFLVFYGIYFISSIYLYFRGRFRSYYAKLGVAIFIGSISYMITGLTNDSNINTSPIFWMLMGVGIAVNMKAKPLIKEEISEIKAQKAENKSSVK